MSSTVFKSGGSKRIAGPNFNLSRTASPAGLGQQPRTRTPTASTSSSSASIPSSSASPSGRTSTGLRNSSFSGRNKVKPINNNNTGSSSSTAPPPPRLSNTANTTPTNHNSRGTPHAHPSTTTTNVGQNVVTNYNNSYRSHTPAGSSSNGGKGGGLIGIGSNSSSGRGAATPSPSSSVTNGGAAATKNIRSSTVLSSVDGGLTSPTVTTTVTEPPKLAYASHARSRVGRLTTSLSQPGVSTPSPSSLSSSHLDDNLHHQHNTNNQQQHRSSSCSGGFMTTQKTSSSTFIATARNSTEQQRQRQQDDQQHQLLARTTGQMSNHSLLSNNGPSTGGTNSNSHQGSLSSLMSPQTSSSSATQNNLTTGAVVGGGVDVASTSATLRGRFSGSGRSSVTSSPAADANKTPPQQPRRPPAAATPPAGGGSENGYFTRLTSDIGTTGQQQQQPDNNNSIVHLQQLLPPQLQQPGGQQSSQTDTESNGSVHITSTSFGTDSSFGAKPRQQRSHTSQPMRSSTTNNSLSFNSQQSSQQTWSSDNNNAGRPSVIINSTATASTSADHHERQQQQEQQQQHQQQLPNPQPHGDDYKCDHQQLMVSPDLRSIGGSTGNNDNNNSAPIALMPAIVTAAEMSPSPGRLSADSGQGAVSAYALFSNNKKKKSNNTNNINNVVVVEEEISHHKKNPETTETTTSTGAGGLSTGFTEGTSSHLSCSHLSSSSTTGNTAMAVTPPPVEELHAAFSKLEQDEGARRERITQTEYSHFVRFAADSEPKWRSAAQKLQHAREAQEKAAERAEKERAQQQQHQLHMSASLSALSSDPATQPHLPSIPTNHGTHTPSTSSSSSSSSSLSTMPPPPPPISASQKPSVSLPTPVHSSSHFDSEAHKLFAALGLRFEKGEGGTVLTGAANKTYNDLDCIFRAKPQRGGGNVFVGNQMAAASLDVLNAHNITHVVNCTNGVGAIPNYHEVEESTADAAQHQQKNKKHLSNRTSAAGSPPLSEHASGVSRSSSSNSGTAEKPDNGNSNSTGSSIQYYRFPVSDWQTQMDVSLYDFNCRMSHSRMAPELANSPELRKKRHFDNIREFLGPLFRFMDEAIMNGEGVLIHCLAGAHRAGTTGILALMHYAGLDYETAIPTAKQIRPAIDPICDFPKMLEYAQLGGIQEMYDESWNGNKPGRKTVAGTINSPADPLAATTGGLGVKSKSSNSGAGVPLAQQVLPFVGLGKQQQLPNLLKSPAAPPAAASSSTATSQYPSDASSSADGGGIPPSSHTYPTLNKTQNISSADGGLMRSPARTTGLELARHMGSYDDF